MNWSDLIPLSAAREVVEMYTTQPASSAFEARMRMAQAEALHMVKPVMYLVSWDLGYEKPKLCKHRKLAWNRRRKLKRIQAIIAQQMAARTERAGVSPLLKGRRAGFTAPKGGL